MNQMRHNFSQNNSFASQLLNMMSVIVTDLSGATSLSYELHHIMEKPWRSATYDGNIYQYDIQIKCTAQSCNPIGDPQIAILNQHLWNHEFTLIKSFVADVKASRTSHEDQMIMIEVLIINEE